MAPTATSPNVTAERWSRNEPIAIIGTGCRFPGSASTPSKFWDLLKEPRDLCRPIPATRFDAQGFYHPDPLYHGHSNVLHSYTLDEDHRVFDAPFFGIKPVEANAIDPQQRLLLETVYASIESAGLRMEDLHGSDTAVLVGLMCNDYEAQHLRDFAHIPTYHATGIARSIMSNRISYFFDWHGPSITIDTACSSSLIAVHQAVQILRSGDSRVAVACGSNLLLGPENYVAESKLKMLSPTGRSRMWDRSADGYARGDGVAAVTLKLLSEALRDGDQIECLIRESGTNQDGRTKGITMPSATAQAALIRDTYAKAGLDPLKENDRCQYFEAHGTGTPAGDPIEAEAISSAFFDAASVGSDPLYVGSVKTVIGHTEGTAGLAALIKAALALRSELIPPNLLFEELNPAIIPFYTNLEVPTQAKPWPTLPGGVPRRASVNSFGFGGSNAHVILESYQPAPVSHSDGGDRPMIPLVFSAFSEKALKASLAKYSGYLQRNASLSLRNLAYNLHARRSRFQYRAAFSASTVDDLQSQLDAALQSHTDQKQDVCVRASIPEKPRTLAIFTGQGAQYPRMIAGLYESSAYVRSIVEQLEAKLSQLPDGPPWSLKQELLADISSSRVHEAAFSQPLCTAVQIVLVDLLRVAGVQLDAVVGHSSGEIGAAYAAGLLTKEDAICIAYYRGKHSHLARSADGRTGAMMAVGTSPEDADDLCDMDEFRGRIAVAAVNSSASVTISGDADAIAEATTVLEDERKFVRQLKVDRAYHSHHMRACSDAYLASLAALEVSIGKTAPGMSWHSSVYAGTIAADDDKLKGLYWDENMVRPVLFAQAIADACAAGAFDLAVEIGPHPALKGPASQVMQDITGESIPYTSFLSRGEDARDSFATGLGFLWAHLQQPNLTLEAFETTVGGHTHFEVMKELPTYRFDHERPYWHESRTSRAFRTNSAMVHELLGALSADSTSKQRMWKHMLRPKEIPWIQGHQLQNQTVFPAAGYMSSAFEASKSLIDPQKVQLIELDNFIIHQALVFNDDDTGVEISICLSGVEQSEESIVADFSYHAATGRDADTLTLMASAKLKLILGEPARDVLPGRHEAESNLVAVEDDRFYTSLEALGYGYTGPFRALTGLQRKLGKATGSILDFADNHEHSLMAHPAMLDAAIQSVILAHCYPNDGQLWSLHLPTSIRRICVNPALCSQSTMETRKLPFDSVLTGGEESGIYGDVDIFPVERNSAFVQLEGMRAVPFSPATAANDVELFSHMLWDVATPDAEIIAQDNRATVDDYNLAYVLDRVSSFYLRKLDAEFAPDFTARHSGPYVGLFRYAKHVNQLVASGKHPYAKKEWLSDSYDDIVAESARFPHSSDLKIIHIVGEQMPRVLRNETTILEHLLPGGLLDDYYVNALGFPQFSTWLARMAKQLTHRYPQMRILEVGAGTGGATKSILKSIGQSFSTYTFTDISNGFFGKAQEVFSEYEDKMTFRALNAEKDVVAQGFEEGAYDLVVASFVIHATAKLETTMKNVRKLLRPGGFALLAEVTNNDQIRGGFIFGALPGWWLGEDDGRILSPCVGPVEWDELFRRTGFSGIEAITPQDDRFPFPGSVFITQAVDDRISFLRQPMLPHVDVTGSESILGDVTIIGGSTIRTSRMVAELQSILRGFSTSVRSVKTIDEPMESFTTNSTFLSLVELDETVFKDLSPSRFESLKQLFGHEKTMLWITEGRRADNPFSNMTLGFARSQFWEVPDLKVQFIDVEATNLPTSQAIAEALLRYSTLTKWEREDNNVDILFSNEPEIILGDQGQQLIPRLYPIAEANDRYNSARRALSHSLDSAGSEIELAKTTSGYLVRQATNNLKTADQSRAAIQVSRSTAFGVKTKVGPRFVVSGTLRATGKRVLALSTAATSTIYPTDEEMIPCDVAVEKEDEFLSLVSARIAAQCVLNDTSHGDTIVIHEPSDVLTTVLEQTANDIGVKLVFTSSKVNGGRYRHINSYASRRVIRSQLPQAFSKFVDLSVDVKPAQYRTGIWACLPPECATMTWADLYTDFASTSSTNTRDDGSCLDQLKAVSAQALKDIVSKDESEIASLSLEDIAEGSFPEGPCSAIINWSKRPSSLAVQPIDTFIEFSGEKTYWLVGLTGGLGLSLCEWMIQHGARYVVITSRNPKVDKNWLEQTKLRGATVKICANDVTQEDQVRELYEEINRTMPPIAGVAQGAMVLDDIATRDMTYEQMMKVLRPKVDGSIFLDKLFADQKLDFFVFFSSMTGVIGNIGQSAYTTANTFMCSLAAQRRKRGLSGSAIDIGVIIGVGYVTREVNNAGQENLRKGGYMWMSEGDFHQIFAEAVLAGRGESTSDAQISTGLRQVTSNDPYLPIWYNNPKFAHYVKKQAADTTQTNSSSNSIPIKTRLLEAKSRGELVHIVQETFLTKLQALLQLDDTTNALETRTDDLGLDSLVAVEVRSWFHKNYQVNIPVLKILGGILIKEIIDHAVDGIPKNLTPLVDQDTSGSSETLNSVDPPESESSSNISNSDENEPTDLHQLSSLPSKSDISSSYISTPHSSGLNTPPSVISESIDPPKKTERSEALSFGQEMFWFVNELLEDKTTLNHTGLFRVRGNIRGSDLEKAVRAVAQQHESLRTFFFTDDDNQPRQGIMATPTLKLEKKHIDVEDDALQEFSRLKQHEYDLKAGSTMRILLLSLSPNQHYLLIGCHHINVDGVSHQVLMSDLLKVYNRQVLNPDILQFPDYAARQRARHRNGAWKPEIAFWKKEFQNIPEPLPILSVRPPMTRRSLTKYAVHRVDYRVPTVLANRIRAACKAHRCTAFHFYLAVFNRLLFRYSNSKDICVGIGDNNRTENDELESIGPFVNMLPLRFNMDESKTFAESLVQTRLKAYSALANGQVPFEVILDELTVPRSSTHSPLFQAFVDYRQGTQEKARFGTAELDLMEFEAGRTAYDISLDIIDNTDNDALLMFMVQQDIYSLRDANVLVKTYVELLETFSTHPEKSFNKILKYKPSEYNAILKVSKGPSFESQWPETAIHRVEEMILAHEKDIALTEIDGTTMTYAQMGNRVNSIAQKLLNENIEAGVHVAIFQEPSVDWICSMLAILKIGAIYVPLDPSIPLHRLGMVVDDCHPAAILLQDETLQRASDLSMKHAKLINISEVSLSNKTVAVSAESGATALVLYTSGTTGAPKGISLSHSNLASEVEVSARVYGLGQEVVLQQSALGFDMSVLQMLLALCLGGRLCLVPRSMRGDSVAITKYMVEQGVSYTCATPVEYASWIHHGDANLRSSAWRVALSGGEAFTDSLLQSFCSLGKSDLRIFNGYGPTETTCCSTKIELTHWGKDPIPAGYPSPNESVYILDEENPTELVPLGLPGEIAIGGTGVAQGYLNNDSLTKSAFLTDPFADQDYIQRGWTKMYRTGDRGRLLENGQLLIEGRISNDTQIKLRGIRIDLTDIEQTILDASEGALVQSVVSCRTSGASGPQFLVAHVVFGPSFPAADRVSFLQSLSTRLPLPQYMRPDLILPLEKLPTTDSSKVDRRAVTALPLPHRSEATKVPALSPVGTQLREIWEQVLVKEVAAYHNINSDADFFHVGGNSMLLVDLQARIQSEFSVTIPLVELFESSTLGSMAARIENGIRASAAVHVDWTQETAVEDLSEFLTKGAEIQNGSSPKSVVLTGAAGFLGQYILRQLVAHPEIETIHCIAIRQLSSRKSLFDSHKIRLYEGDLTQPLLGLSKQDASAIFSHAGAIIHNAADISHLKNYSTLKPANFESTKELVKLSLGRKIPIHYVSTAGVSMFTVRESFGEVSARDHAPPTDGSDGYTATKWASEIYLENVQREHDLPVWIHRPSSIVQPSSIVAGGNLDMLQNLLKYSRALRAVPSSPNLRGVVDLVYPETVSENIVKDVVRNDGRGVSYKHQTGDLDMSIDGMKEYLEKQTGQPYRVLPIGQWASLAEAEGLNTVLAAMFGNVEALGALSFPKFVRG